MRRGGAALAHADAEDEWTPENEAELGSLAAAEGYVWVSGSFQKTIIHHAQAETSTHGGVVYLPLWTLQAHGEKVSFHHALMVTLEQEDGKGVVLGSPELRMWGAGDDTFSALKDFSGMFVSVLRSYENTPADELTPDAADYLGMLKALISGRDNIQGS